MCLRVQHCWGFQQMDVFFWAYLPLVLLSFVVTALLPGALVATITCFVKGWSKAVFWSACAKANMVLAWVPVVLLIFSAPFAQSHGAGFLGALMLSPILLVAGLVWYLLNRQFLKTLDKTFAAHK